MRTAINYDVAGIWPSMSRVEETELLESIRISGLRRPILRWHGEIVDGRHRQRACDATGQPAAYVDLPDAWDIGQVVRHVAIEQEAQGVHRHMTTAQRAEVAVKLLAYASVEAKAKQAEAGKTHGRGQADSLASNEAKLSDENPPAKKRAPKAAAKVAEQLGVSTSTVERMKRKLAPPRADGPKAALIAKTAAKRAQIGELLLAGRSAQEAADALALPIREVFEARNKLGIPSAAALRKEEKNALQSVIDSTQERIETRLDAIRFFERRDEARAKDYPPFLEALEKEIKAIQELIKQLKKEMKSKS